MRRVDIIKKIQILDETVLCALSITRQPTSTLPQDWVHHVYVPLVRGYCNLLGQRPMSYGTLNQVRRTKHKFTTGITKYRKHELQGVLETRLDSFSDIPEVINQIQLLELLSWISSQFDFA